MAQAPDPAPLRDASSPGASRRDEPATRGHIIATAERFFREIGYRKTTVADIAKALRMSPANVYRYFDSKTAINEAVVERLMGEVEAAMETAATLPGHGAADRLREVAIVANEMCTERCTANRRMHEMVEVAMVESWPLVQRHIARIDDILQRLVAAGVASTEFRVADPLVAARCVHAALLRFWHPALIVQCADEPGPTLDAMVDFLVASLCAEPADRAATRARSAS